jgi:hypothetical protein
MDSKNIYNSYLHYENKIEWEMNGEREWIYLGSETEFNEDEVAESINTFFEEYELYLITDRHSSSLIEKNKAIKNVKELSKEYGPVLTNTDFSKMMEFHRIIMGFYRVRIMRKGQRKNLD